MAFQAKNRDPKRNTSNSVLKNKNQAAGQGARRCDKRSIFKHM